jgi:glycopeptide antibiotics resistance protein
MLLSFDAPTLLIAFLLLVFGLVLVRLKSGNFYHVFFCAIFGVYLIAVVGVVVFPFPIVYDLPNFKPSINLIPF